MKRPEWNKIGRCVVTAVFAALLVTVGVLQKTARTEVDVILFAGQSNMSGVGDASLAPAVPEGVGYEFRAITDPTRLYPLAEPLEKMRTIPVCVTTGDCWNEPVPWCLRL